MALSLALIPVLFHVQKNRDLVFKAGLFLLANAAFAFFGLLSISWSHSTSEAWFSASKEVIVLILLFTFIYLHQKDPRGFLPLFIRFCCIIPLLGILFALFQMGGMKDLSKGSAYDVTGINGHKNLFSAFLFVNSFFLILGIRTLDRSWKLLAIVALVLSAAMIAFLRTKAVFTGGILALLVFSGLKYGHFIWKRFLGNRTVLFLLIWITMNVTVLFLFPILTKRGLSYNAEHAKLENSYSSSKELDNERLVLWDKTISMSKKNFICGVGAGNWQIFFPNETLWGLYRAEDLNFTFQRPHNDLLWIWSETGIIGLNLFFLACTSLIVMVLYSYNKSSDDRIRFGLLLSLAFLAGFLALSVFDFPKERMELLCWITLVMGFAYVTCDDRGKVLLQGKTPSSFILGGIVLLALFVYTGIMRSKGEYFTRKMYDARNSGFSAGVIENGNKAENYFYRLDPTTIPISWYTGNAFVLLQRNDEAHTAFLHALDLNPYNKNILNDLGSSFALKKDNRSAEKYYLEASRVSPRFDDAKLNLIAIYISEQKYREASSLLDSIYHESERRSNYRKMVNALLGK